ncbi:hypothetical protein [Siminovitchia fordii]|uniref:Restriction endonuclease n=1 Tax=Siminovitchia fordii TaxID=254759 RepID=A0ABQ4KAA8_9BACI|nr:hypothetical protein [Siminovitchia fordii]GIN22541.1 hypothetical protein J1TS3_36750 [Siminovitchia fordii]
MSRLVKCPYCEEKLPKSESHPYKKRYYHLECFNEWRNQADHRKELIEYICELYGIDAPTGMMVKQIKEFVEDYNYKYKGMELALRYFYETLGNQVLEGSGIGIIPYIYEDARQHHLTMMNVAESVENLEKLNKKSKSVIVKSPTVSYTKKTKKIDIGAL